MEQLVLEVAKQVPSLAIFGLCLYFIVVHFLKFMREVHDSFLRHMADRDKKFEEIQRRSFDVQDDTNRTIQKVAMSLERVETVIQSCPAVEILKSKEKR